MVLSIYMIALCLLGSNPKLAYLLQCVSSLRGLRAEECFAEHSLKDTVLGLCLAEVSERRTVPVHRGWQVHPGLVGAAAGEEGVRLL